MQLYVYMVGAYQSSDPLPLHCTMNFPASSTYAAGLAIILLILYKHFKRVNVERVCFLVCIHTLIKFLVGFYTCRRTLWTTVLIHNGLPISHQWLSDPTRGLRQVPPRHVSNSYP